MFLMQKYSAMKYLMMLTLLILSSCSKDSNPIDNVTSKNPFDYLSDADKEDRTNQMTDYLKSSLEIDYKKDLTLIRDKAPEYKAAYEKASDHPADRLKYLMYGKDLERRSKSCFHANDLLQFDAQH